MNGKVFACGAPMVRNRAACYALRPPERLLAPRRRRGGTPTARRLLACGRHAQRLAVRTTGAVRARAGLAWPLAQNLAAANSGAAWRRTLAADLTAASPAFDAGDMTAIAALPKGQRVASSAPVPKRGAP